jgi:hypothetical protein
VLNCEWRRKWKHPGLEGTNKTEFEKEPVSCRGHENMVRDVVFAPDSETFASGGQKYICMGSKGGRRAR